MTALATPPKLQFLDANGAPLVGGKLYTYAAGTTTPQVTYTDFGGGTANANPVILDSRGEASVWLGTALYKMALYSATDVLIWTVDNIGGFATLAQLAASGGSNLVGFLQAGTGAVATTVQAKLRETVSVKDFGAVADWNGTTGTDNYPFFQAAINYLFSVGGGTLVFPQGFYRIASPLNLAGNGTTGRYGNTPIVFQGAGMGNAFDTGSWSTYGGSWIVGQTGGWIMDCTGLQYFNMYEMGLRGTGTNASKGGILFARSTIVNFAQNCTLRRNTIWIDSSPAYTAVGSIGVANNGAESFNMEQNWVIADTPVAFTFNNSTDLNLVSPYVTIATSPLSSTNIEARGNTFQAITKYALYLQGVEGCHFDNNVYACESTSVNNYAIQLIAGGSSGTAHCQDIRITGQIESQGGAFGGAVRFDDNKTWNISIDLFHNNPILPYISTGGVVMNGNRINVHRTNGSTGQYIFTASSASTFNGGELNIYNGDTGLSANTNLTLSGAFVRGNNFSVAGSLGVSLTSSYLATGTNGLTLVNAAGNTGSILNATAVTVFTLPAGVAGTYRMSARLPAGVGSPANYSSSAEINWDGAVARVTANNGANLPITVAGASVQVSQSSGGTQATGINWSIFTQYLA
jgi:hypothetical protein